MADKSRRSQHSSQSSLDINSQKRVCLDDCPQDDTTWLDDFELNAMQRLFVLAYICSRNGAEAARRAGYSHRSASEIAYRLLRKDQIQAAVRIGQQKIEAFELGGAGELLRTLWAKVSACPADIVELRHGACRYCYGTEHEYQWRDLVEHREAETADPPRGGFGYRQARSPNKDCPRCEGLGQPHVTIRDTRDLDEAGRAIFRSVKQTKDGFEIKFADNTKAIDLLARHLGLFNAPEENPYQRLAEQIMAVAKPVPVAGEADVSDQDKEER